MTNNTLPTNITFHQESNKLELTYGENYHYLSAEYLRVHSPSAEVRGHSKGQEILQINKEHVGIKQLEPVGNYALKIYFDDGHNSGIFTWDYLYELATEQTEYWQRYLKKLEEAGFKRNPD